MDASNATSMAAAGADTVSPYLHAISEQAVAAQTLGLMTIILDFPCFLWHVENRNLPASLMVGWVMWTNFTAFINAFIWPIDDLATFWNGQGYCDVITKLEVISSLSKLGCALCIMRSLARALDTKRPSLSSATGLDLIRQRLIESGICIGCPLLFGLAQFIMSDRRYDIYAILGCSARTQPNWAFIPLVGIWPTVFCLVSCYFGTLIIMRLRRYKREYAAVLASNNTGMSTSRFLRLLALSGVFIIVYLPFSCYDLFINTEGLSGGFNWSEMHNPATYQTVSFYQMYGQVDYQIWIRITEGFVVFGIFGFGKDIGTIYTRILTSLGITRVYNSISTSLANSRRSPSDASASSLRKRSIFSRRTRRTATSTTASSGSSTSKLKVRAKSVLSRLMITPPLYSRHARSETATSFSSTNITSPPPPYASPTAHAPSPFQARPTGLAEKDLFDIDVEANTNTNTNPHPNNSPPDPNPTKSEPSSQPTALPSVDATDFRPNPPGRSRSAELTLPVRSRFWQRLNTYVSGMGPRPAANLGVMTGPRTSRDAVAAINRRGSAWVAPVSVAPVAFGGPVVGGARTGAVLAGAHSPEPSDLEVLREREYEAVVVGALV